MPEITKSVEIDSPVERVFEFMTHPENLPEIWPSLVDVSNVERSEDATHSFDWVYKMAGIRFRGHAAASEVEKNRRVVVKNETGIPSTFHYAYDDIGERTLLTMHIEYTIPGQLLSKLAEPILRRLNEHEAESLLNNLKVRMEHPKQPETPMESRPPR